jgi:hypothetical protein
MVETRSSTKGPTLQESNHKSQPTKAQSPPKKQSDTRLVESGLVYFPIRSRVNIEEPEGVNDIQRTYFVLRPVASNVKIEDELKKDGNNCRLLALPKKVFPKSPKDRFMALVERAKVSISTLKTEFFHGYDYETKTRGTQHQQPVTPIAEGVYSITESGGSTYLSYVLTIPYEIDQAQYDLGLQDRGAFIVSVKNPMKPGPVGTNLPKGPEYSKK